MIGRWSKVIAVLVLFAAALRAQEPTITITGRAVDQDGRALPGVDVAPLDRGAWRVGDAVMTTGADGMFTLVVAQPGSLAELPLQVAAGRPASPLEYVLRRNGRVMVGLDLRVMSALRGWNPGQTDLGDVVMQPGVQLRGTVRDEAGKPLAGIMVEARDCMQASGLLRVGSFADLPGVAGIDCIATTDAEGRFVLQGTPTSGLEITAHAEGHARARQAPVAMGDRLELTLVATGFARGKVVDADGKSVATDLFLRDELGSSAQGRSSDDGSFAIPLPSRSRYRIEEHVADFARSDEQDPEPTWFEGARDDLRVVTRAPASPPKQLVLTVVDAETGAAIAGVRAGVSWQGFFAQNLPDLFTARRFITNFFGATDGTIGLPAPPTDSRGEGKGMVLVTAPGHTPALQAVAWEDDGVELRIGLRKSTPVRGRVVDATTGKPLRATVAARFVVGPIDQLQREMVGGTPVSPTLTTGDDGTFLFDELPASKLELVASAQDRPDSPATTLDLGKALPEGDLKLEVPRGTTLSLELKAAKGSLDGAWVVATDSPGSGAQRGRQAATVMLSAGPRAMTSRAWRVGGDGRVVLRGLSPGKWSFALRGAGPRSTTVGHELALGSVEVADEDLSRSFEVAGISPGSIRGNVVLDGAELPADRLAVLARRVVTGRAAQQTVVVTSGPPQTDAYAYVDRTSSFEVQLPRGTWRLTVMDIPTAVELMESEEIEVTASESSTHDLRVRCGAVRIHLVPEREGQLLAGRRISIDLPDRQGAADAAAWGGTSPMQCRLVDEQREQLIYLPDEKCSLDVIPLPVLVTGQRAAAVQMIGVAGGRGRRAIGTAVHPSPGKVVDVDLKIPAK